MIPVTEEMITAAMDVAVFEAARGASARHATRRALAAALGGCQLLGDRSRPAMTPAQMTDVIEGLLDDWLGDAEPVTRHREIAEALTETWLKDRRRALGQASVDSGSSPSGGGA